MLRLILTAAQQKALGLRQPPQWLGVMLVGEPLSLNQLLRSQRKHKSQWLPRAPQMTAAITNRNNNNSRRRRSSSSINHQSNRILLNSPQAGHRCM